MQTYPLIAFFQIMTHCVLGAPSAVSLNWLLFGQPDGVRGGVSGWLISLSDTQLAGEPSDETGE